MGRASEAILNALPVLQRAREHRDARRDKVGESFAKVAQSVGGILQARKQKRIEDDYARVDELATTFIGTEDFDSARSAMTAALASLQTAEGKQYGLQSLEKILQSSGQMLDLKSRKFDYDTAVEDRPIEVDTKKTQLEGAKEGLINERKRGKLTDIELEVAGKTAPLRVKEAELGVEGAQHNLDTSKYGFNEQKLQIAISNAVGIAEAEVLSGRVADLATYWSDPNNRTMLAARVGLDPAGADAGRLDAAISERAEVLAERKRRVEGYQRQAKMDQILIDKEEKQKAILAAAHTGFPKAVKVMQEVSGTVQTALETGEEAGPEYVLQRFLTAVDKMEGTPEEKYAAADFGRGLLPLLIRDPKKAIDVATKRAQIAKMAETLAISQTTGVPLDMAGIQGWPADVTEAEKRAARMYAWSQLTSGGKPNFDDAIKNAQQPGDADEVDRILNGLRAEGFKFAEDE